MNIRRGLFRLWIVATILLTAIVIALSWHEFASPYLPPLTYVFVSAADDENSAFADLIPTTLPGSFVQSVDGKDIDLIDTHTRVDFPDSLSLMVRRPVSNENLRAISDQFAAESAGSRGPEISSRRWDTAKALALSIMVPSLVVLLVGSTLIWAFSGFSRR